MTSAPVATSSDTELSTTPSSQCSICSSRVAVYTCPRCATRSCSLPCSVAHKARTGCSGLRDKAKFVPMNRYTHGTMTDDYVFLEDMSRRVSGWGQDIARGGYGTSQGRRGRGGMGRGKTREIMSRKKRDVLKLQLELRDVEVDLLPAGMQRRVLNQSAWDPKCRTAFLTVEYNIHPPHALDACPDDTQAPYALLTHRNNFDLSLRDLFRSQISQRATGRNRADLPTWVKTLTLPHPDMPDAFTPPQFFIRAPLDPLSGKREKFGFIKLDGERKLSALLRNKQFVEFPTIDVWEEGAFCGVLLDGSGAFELPREQRPGKKRKLDVSKGRAAIAGLLGDYGSEDSDEVDTALTRLGEYDGSDAENRQPTTSVEGDTDSLTEDDEGDQETMSMVDPATLLALVQEAQRRSGEDGDSEEVDWGESDKDS
ncbi:hypothetical protein BJV78DRAFT_1126659 [Lactifluus subvellereus]|nr:hypothetical protein BJV78DRAFT_1126659 [Lactifluus subvellereus]